MQKPYIELYRPQTLDDVVGNSALIERLNYFIKNGNMPNLLLSSSPGTGKTTIAHCLGRQMLGKDYGQAFIELNASDERNITDIRERVRTFAQLQITLPVGRHKIIFLDECDLMTSQAQMALRRILEDFQESTRFVLACNLVAKIIEPLQSRCCVVTLQTPTVVDIQQRLKQICTLATIEYSDECLKQIASLADGDVRSAVNNLQTAALSLNKKLTVQGIKDALDYISVDQVKLILDDGKQNFDQGWSRMHSLIKEGFSSEEIINAFYRYGMDADNKMPDTIRARYLKSVAQAHARIATGIGSELQVARLYSEVLFVEKQ